MVSSALSCLILSSLSLSYTLPVKSPSTTYGPHNGKMLRTLVIKWSDRAVAGRLSGEPSQNWKIHSLTPPQKKTFGKEMKSPLGLYS